MVDRSTVLIGIGLGIIAVAGIAYATQSKDPSSGKPCNEDSQCPADEGCDVSTKKCSIYYPRT